MAFICCCAPGISANEGSLIPGDAGEFLESPSDRITGALHASTRPNFPNAVGTGTGVSWVGMKRPPDSATPCEREDSNLSSSTGSKSKEAEKTRLQEVVRGFSKQAITGIPVELIDPERAQITQYMFKMDKYLFNMDLRRTQGGTGGSDSARDRSFKLKTITNIAKGHDKVSSAPALTAYAKSILGLELSPEDDEPCTIYFHFKDMTERDRFYTCLKILRMSVEINDKKQ